MKLTLCLLALFLVFASCETSFRLPEAPPKPSELPESISEDPHQAVAQFFEGLFAHFGLDQPKQIIYECFNQKSAALYLISLVEFNKILIDAVARDSFHFHIDVIKAYILAIFEHPVSDCITATQDLSDLLEALGVKRDPFWSAVTNWLYFQAHYAQLLDGYGPVMDGFKKGNFSAAGDAYGALMNDTVTVVKEEGLADLAHIGFSNGFSLGIDIDLPSDSLAAWNDTTAGYDLELIIGGTKAVADGKWWESYDNLVKFWQEKGEEIFNKIPASVWECLAGSDDNKKVTEKLGIDVMSKEFGELAVKWIKKHPFRYHAHAKHMLKSFAELNFVHAGILHGYLTREIAKSK